ncbi:MAG: ATP-binding cassette domain-containing protein [Azospirillaceae bacterium]
MLEVRGLSVSYGKHRALEDVSLGVEPGEIVVILGANGAGKSTLLRAIAGICEGRPSGVIDFDGQAILGVRADRIVERGIALVPEGRGVFGDLTVRENLLLGAYARRARPDELSNLDRVLGLFPKLAERQGQVVRTMSGGEQQMVAIGRAMMSNPSILMLDEPSLGLSPLLCKELFHSLAEVGRSGIGILLVEQNAKQSLAIADRGYLLENAHIVHEDTAVALASDPAVQKAYLGAGKAMPAARSPSVPAPASAERQSPSEIAAAALASVSSRPAPPPPITLAPRPAISRSADDLVGFSVADLVARAAGSALRPGAAKAAADPTRPHAPAAAAGDRLQATLREIERAAAAARRPPADRDTRRPTRRRLAEFER